MTPRAAWRLESHVFAEVFDCVRGEADWFAYGLPLEAAGVALPRADAIAKRDIPRCAWTERIGEVRVRLQSSHWSVCAVTTEEMIVLGLLSTGRSRRRRRSLH